ncbi:MAG: hypothetical protein ACREH8_14500 [Opitutaceae bacterium]
MKLFTIPALLASAVVSVVLVADQPPFAALQQPDPATHSLPSPMTNDVTPRTVIPATHYTLTENTTGFRVRASGPGVVVLTEAWWPDSFRVEIDGRRKPLLRVNHAFKGVFIDEAGDHPVKFSYWPRKFFRSLVLSGIGLVLLAGSLVLALRPARVA